MGICKANLEYHDFTFACCRKGEGEGDTEREREGRERERRGRERKHRLSSINP